MRVFVALHIPAEVRSAIGALMKRLEPECRGARWVRPEGMHLTLKFIGETPEENVERIKRVLGGLRSGEAVRADFRGVGFFPNERHPRVFWAGIEASPNLMEVAADIEAQLEPLGVEREKRAFKPHLTLARFKSEEGLPRLRATLASTGDLEFGKMETRELSLYQSQLRRDGAIYTRVASFDFTRERA